MAVKFLVAAPGQVDDVLAVLNEAAAWLQERGVEQWPPRFDPSWIEGAIRRGETWLVTVDGMLSATVTLDLSDPVWDGVPGTALYVHRMAVRRRASGLGAVILGWAIDVAGQQGHEALRLDCVASNARLRAYYEAAGFAHCGDATVAGAPGQRLKEGPVTVVSRYELRLGNVSLDERGVAVAATGRAAARSWRWHGAAALASAAFPAVFVQAALVANWYVDHPVFVPGDDSPGGGNMGNVLAVPVFAVAAIACLLFPLLWGVAAFRTWKGAAMKDLPVISTVMQGTASLVALPAAATLPHNWADVTILVAADMVALGAALRPRWPRRTLTP